MLSHNEYVIMKLMWDSGMPLTRAEILKGTGPNRDWNPASIHLILNNMISKGALKITDEAKRHGRTYEPCFGREEYVISQVADIFPDLEKEDAISAVISILAKRYPAESSDTSGDTSKEESGKNRRRHRARSDKEIKEEGQQQRPFNV